MRIPIIGILVAVTALFVHTVSCSAPAHANGGSNVRTALEEWFGPYYLLISSQPGRPKVGTVHLTFVLMNREMTEPVRDADIEMVVTPPADSEVEPATYVPSQSQLNPDNYDITIPVETAGEWGFDISIDGTLGQADTRMLLEVTKGGSSIATVLIVVLVFPVFLIALWVSLRWRQARKQRAA